MQVTTTVAIIDGAKITIIQLAKKYATNIFFCVLFISNFLLFNLENLTHQKIIDLLKAIVNQESSLQGLRQ